MTFTDDTRVKEVFYGVRVPGGHRAHCILYEQMKATLKARTECYSPASGLHTQPWGSCYSVPAVTVNEGTCSERIHEDPLYQNRNSVQLASEMTLLSLLVKISRAPEDLERCQLELQ